MGNSNESTLCRTQKALGLAPLEVRVQALLEGTREDALKDPINALIYAREIDKSPSADTRTAACREAGAAYSYAKQVDQASREDTRTAACGCHIYAYLYAREVDRRPHPETRAAAARNPAVHKDYEKDWGSRTLEESQQFWRDAEKGPQDDTRAFYCEKGPVWALNYAQWVDQFPRDDTRTAACGEAKCAYMYALRVDEAPCDETRTAACEGSIAAYLYAVFVDKGEHPETQAAAETDTMSHKMYTGRFPLEGERL